MRGEVFAALGLVAPMAQVPLPLPAQDIAGLLATWTEARPDAEALVGRYRRLTFAELDTEANAAAAVLRELGVRPGDRVAATLANHPELAVAFVATQRLGAVWVGINRNYAAPEKVFMLKDCGAKVFLADDGTLDALAPHVGEVPLERIRWSPGSQACEWTARVRSRLGAGETAVEADPWAPAAIAYTSGTTGFPKGVVHNQHSMLLAALVSVLRSHGNEAGVVFGTALPMTVLNLMILGPLAAWVAGTSHVCMDRIDAEGVAEWLEAEPITHLSLVPSIVQDLLNNPAIRPSSIARLRHLVAGAAIVPEGLPALYKERFGRPMRVGYGLTEAPTGVCGADDGTPDRQGAIGRPLVHVEVRILNADDSEAPIGEAGEICFRAASDGPLADCYSGPLGYWGRPEESARLLRNGWVHTGDIGNVDDAGQFFIHDRRSDLIIRGGANIYPAEVERVLRTDSRVRDCAVVGRPDARLGETVAAFVEPFPDCTSEELVGELAALCATQIAGYKVPAHWFVVEQLPRNAMGKVLKKILRDGLADVDRPGLSAA